MADLEHRRIEGAVLPVAGEVREILVQHVVEREIAGIQRLDIAGGVQLLDEFRVRQDHIVGAGRGLRDQRHHVVAARIVFGLELHIVGFLERADDVGLAVAVPSQHVEFRRACPGAPDERRRQGHAAGGLQHAAARDAAGPVPFFREFRCLSHQPVFPL